MREIGLANDWFVNCEGPPLVANEAIAENASEEQIKLNQNLLLNNSLQFSPHKIF